MPSTSSDTASNQGFMLPCYVVLDQVLAFDLDTYRLLLKQLAAPHRSGVELLRFDA